MEEEEKKSGTAQELAKRGRQRGEGGGWTEGRKEAEKERKK